MRLVTEESGLDFLPVRDELYDLCFPEAWEGDHRIRALLQIVRSAGFRRAIAELPGYHADETGEVDRIS